MGGKNKRDKKRKHSSILPSHSLIDASGALVATAVITTVPSSDNHDNNDDDATSISQADMATCLCVLNRCGQQPDLVTRELRKALHPFVVQRIQAYEPVNYCARVSECLSKRKWGDALLALEASFDLYQFPKQGTVQRWVRDVSVASSDMNMRLLKAIIKLTSLANNNSNNNSASDKDKDHFANSSNGDENLHDPARQLALLKEKQRLENEKGTESNHDNLANDDVEILPGWMIPRVDTDNSLQDCTSQALPLPTASRVLYSEKAAERTPPNHYDLLLHYCEPGYMEWQAPGPTTMILKTHVPFCNEGLCLSRVLSPRECHLLQSRAEALGYRPDHPTTLRNPTGIDSCEWYVDESILNPLFERVRPFLPEQIQTKNGSSVALCGINARFRFFRYAQGCVYRPHIDGSWPESTIDANGNYCTTLNATTKSYLTFLMYLNDDFTGGETRFYIANGNGGMTVHGIIPQQGSVLCFPQGNTASLVHEGSAVTDGCKYVVRTDVLYQAADDKNGVE
jgi:hypothetical protein